MKLIEFAKDRIGMRAEAAGLLSVRRLSWTVLSFALLLYFVMDYIIAVKIFPTGTLRLLAAPTAGLVSATLLANGFLMLTVLGVLWGIGRLRLRDLGLRSEDVIVACIVSTAVWLTINLFEIAWAASNHIPLQIDPRWSDRGVGYVMGALLGQVLGNALFEEIFFRGVLFRQLYSRFLSAGQSASSGLLWAIVISQGIFAFAHTPLRIASGMPLADLPGELLLLFVLGSLLALLYWRTGNLALCVGVHALSNTPTTIVAAPIDLATSGIITVVCSILIILLWPASPLKPQHAHTHASPH